MINFRLSLNACIDVTNLEVKYYKCSKIKVSMVN